MAVVDQEIGGYFVDDPLFLEAEEDGFLLTRHGSAVPLAEVVAQGGRAGREAAAYVADVREHGFCFCREDKARTMPMTYIVRDFLAIALFKQVIYQEYYGLKREEDADPLC